MSTAALGELGLDRCTNDLGWLNALAMGLVLESSLEFFGDVRLDRLHGGRVAVVRAC